MLRGKLSISEICSDSKYTEECRPRVCISFQEMLEWYTTKFKCGYQTAFSELVHLGIKNFHMVHDDMFEDHVKSLNTAKFDPLGQNTDDIIGRRCNYVQRGTAITYIIVQLWPHGQHRFRPHILLTESDSATMQRMRGLYGIDSCALLKLYISYAFMDALEDTELYEKIRGKIDKKLRE